MSKIPVSWLLAAALALLLVYLGMSDVALPGADEGVSAAVAGYAREVGAGERPPLINTDKGDLLLFVFAVGGAAAGFVLGWHWDRWFAPHQVRQAQRTIRVVHR